MTPKSLLLAAALLAAPLALPHLASANVDACVGHVDHGAPTFGTNAVVTGSAAWRDGSCNGKGVIGATAPCVANAGPAFGQYCGRYYAPFETATCEWETPPGSTVADLVVGFDADLDGHVYANTADEAYAEWFPVPVPLVLNTFRASSAAGGNLIAYPVSIVPGGSPLDVTFIACY